MPDAIVIRYGEIFLKRGRRRYFTDCLKRNVAQAVRAHRDLDLRVVAPYGRLLVRRRDGAPLSAEQATRVARSIERVFGVESIHVTRVCEPSLDALAAAVQETARESLAVQPAASFRITASRTDKRFELTSIELNRVLGGAVLEVFPRLHVDLHHPDLEITVEVRPQEAFVSAQASRGPGGLPVGSNGDAVLLLSGGIDSPVAAWLTMKRGVRVHALYFHAFPYTGEQTLEKVRRIASTLAAWQGSLDLYVAPMAAFQEHCREHAPPKLLVLLYRRFMVRLADRLARKLGAPALVTGEAVGQVASQTLHNLWTIEAVTDLPVLRPLAGHDKKETIALARRIGTYDLSVLPFDDCCSLFVPAHPETRATPDRLERVEQRLDLTTHLDNAWHAIESERILPGPHTTL